MRDAHRKEDRKDRKSTYLYVHIRVHFIISKLKHLPASLNTAWSGVTQKAKQKSI